MLSRLARQSVRKCSKLSHQSTSTTVISRTFANHYKKLTIFGGFACWGCYDYFWRDAEEIGGVVRFARSLKIAAQISIDYNVGLNGLDESSEEYEKVIKEIHQKSANRLLQGCLLNGGLYIKLGQGVAAINHMLPVEYTDTLKLLEDKCLERKQDEVNRLFLEDFGDTPDNLFAEFNYQPIAAASLAQVFRAKTKDGDDVAVKVQYIDLQKRFRGDVGTILFLNDLIAFFHKNYNFGWMIRDLRRSLEMELDFNHEADNADRCSADLKHFKHIHIPKVHRQMTGARVLTAEFIDDACKISDKKSLKEMQIDLKEVDKKLFEVFAYQIFSTGFVHSDPHPGNIFVRKDKKGKVQLVLLDHGLYETIPENIRNDLCCFWEAIVLRDYAAMKVYGDKLNVSDHKRFAEILLQKPLEINKFSFATKYTEQEVQYMKKVASKHFDLIMTVLKEMPRNLLFILRNLNIIRAIAKEHGDLVDRPKIMARFAISNLLNSGVSVFGFIRRKVHFEYRLWRVFMEFWIMRNYLKLLEILGRAPEDTNLLLNIELKGR